MPAWFDDLATAVAAGDAAYLACEDCGTTTLPPRQICPGCGSTDLRNEPLPGRGTLLSYTEISVTIPKFREETPYTVALVDLGEGITLTGQLREATASDVDVGDEVVLGTEPREEGTDVLTFRPATE